MQWPQSLRIQIGKEVRNEGAVSQSLEAAHATDLIVSLLIFEERSYWFFFFSSRRRHTISLCDWSSDVCSSDLSKLETDQVSASVATLLRICDAMGVRPGTLFDPPSTNLVRNGEARPISLGGEGMVEYLISGDSNDHLMALMSVIQPGGGSGKEPYALTSAADIVHIKQGRLDVTIEGETFDMRAGDTLTFQPSKPHAWRNPSASDVTVALWVIVPPP